MIKKFGIVIGCIILVFVVLFAVVFKMFSPVIDVEERINNINLNDISEESFKELTLIKQEYNKLSDWQKKNVSNFDIYEQAQSKYQQLKDEKLKAVKKWATTSYLPMAKDIKINFQKFVKRENKNYYIASLTNESDEARYDFRLCIHAYDESWTKIDYKYSDKVDFPSGTTRSFEYEIDSSIVDAVKIAAYEEQINNDLVMYDFGEQEILQLK